MTRRSLLPSLLLAGLVGVFFAGQVAAQISDAPPRGEGEGPFERLVLRGGLLVDGTGAPPYGPVDLVIEGNRIAEIRSAGAPGRLRPDAERPARGDREIDASGMYILPGFVDMHGHIGGEEQGTPAEYVFKLWLGHGITTIRDPGSGNGIDWTVRHREHSKAGAITAPRIVPYAFFGMDADLSDADAPIVTPEDARAWVRGMKAKGAEGVKFFGAAPDVLRAALDEARLQGMGTAMHHAQLGVTRANVLQTARWGLGTMEHWYGLPEALFTDRTVQHYPADYNYYDELDRFREAGRLWKQAAPPGSPRWNAVLDTLLALDFTLDPTFNIYDANRDLMRAVRAEWHDAYTLPSLWRFYRPDPRSHGSYFFDWTTDDEVTWKENYRLWMTFVNAYKNRGGRVTTGSDSGYIYQLYGFGFVRELELLQEAGFHPLEVIRAATLSGAEALGLDDRIGSVEVGKLADLVVVPENPLVNLKVLYGTGWIRLDETAGTVRRVGGVRWTIKDGIVYDAPALLDDVRAIVREAKAAEGIGPGPMPVEHP